MRLEEFEFCIWILSCIFAHKWWWWMTSCGGDLLIAPYIFSWNVRRDLGRNCLNVCATDLFWKKLAFYFCIWLYCVLDHLSCKYFLGNFAVVQQILYGRCTLCIDIGQPYAWSCYSACISLTVYCGTLLWACWPSPFFSFIVKHSWTVNCSTALSHVIFGIHCNVIANCAYLTLDFSPVFRRSSRWMSSWRSKYPYCDSFTLASKIRLIKLLKFASSICNSAVWCTRNFFRLHDYHTIA